MFHCFVRPRPTSLYTHIHTCVCLCMCTSLLFTNLPIPEQEIIVVCAFTIVMGYNLLFMSYSSYSAFLYTAFNTMRKIITLYIYNMYDVHYKQNAYNSVC